MSSELNPTIQDFLNYGFQDYSIDFNYDNYKDFNPLSENAMFILESRYLMNRYSKKEKGLIKEKSFYDLCRRCSRLIASGETLYTNDLDRIKLIERNIFIKKRRNTPSFSYRDISRNKVSA